jgi:LacI family transcriptional regulator
LAGYRGALQKAGLPSDSVILKVGCSRLEGGHEAARELPALASRPTAIFATNTLMAIGLMQAVTQQSLRCPDDISVACFDDFEWPSVFHPRLTTVAQPTYEMGSKAAVFPLARLNGQPIADPQECVLSPTLIIRDSCAAPPREGA